MNGLAQLVQESYVSERRLSMGGRAPGTTNAHHQASVRDVAKDAFTELPWLLGAPTAAAGPRLQRRGTGSVREHPSYSQTDEVFAF